MRNYAVALHVPRPWQMAVADRQAMEVEYYKEVYEGHYEDEYQYDDEQIASMYDEEQCAYYYQDCI
jgi:hypothetical protein